MFLEMILALIALTIVGITAPGTKGSPDQLFAQGPGQHLRLPAPARGVGPGLWPADDCDSGDYDSASRGPVHAHRDQRTAGAGRAGDADTGNRHRGRADSHVRAGITGTFKYIWVLFGSANQFMASLALMIASIWLVSEKKKAGFALIPMVFMYLTTMAALVMTCKQLLQQAVNRPEPGRDGADRREVIGNWIAGVIGVVLFVAALVLAYDGVERYRYSGEYRPAGNGKRRRDRRKELSVVERRQGKKRKKGFGSARA